MLVCFFACGQMKAAAYARENHAVEEELMLS